MKHFTTSNPHKVKSIHTGANTPTDIWLNVPSLNKVSTKRTCSSESCKLVQAVSWICTVSCITSLLTSKTKHTFPTWVYLRANFSISAPHMLELLLPTIHFVGDMYSSSYSFSINIFRDNNKLRLCQTFNIFFWCSKSFQTRAVWLNLW